MRPRVTAIVVAHNAATPLERTIAALEAQTWRPSHTVFVHIASRDHTREVMAAGSPDLIVDVPEHSSFGEAVAEAFERFGEIDAGDAARIQEFGSDADTPNDWIWLLSADNTPDPDALEELLDTAERNPSLEVTGPKIMRTDDPSVIVEYGASVAPDGTTVRLHEDALDQGQFEHLSDVLAVAAGGMLVRRDTWERLGGFDSGLDAVDDALDFCVRTWLSNGRVLLSPGARVESLAEKAPGTSRLGARTRALQRYRIERTALLHRQLVWANKFEFFLRWLLLIPGAIGRGVLHLLRKSPGRILPDFRAALTVLFGRTHVGRSRRQFHATREHSLTSLQQLFISSAEMRKLRANRRDEYRAVTQSGRDRFNFITGGGGWVLLIASILAVIVLFPLLRTGTIVGGALLPLSDTIAQVWGNTGYGLRDAGGGTGVADPFAFVLAALASLTFWHPSLIVVVLWVIAIPLSAIGAWYLVARLTRRAWLRAFGAILWMLSPTLFVALAEGRLAGVLVHVALPWLVFTSFSAARSWVSAASCALLAVVVTAASPSLMPALLVLWALAVFVSGRGWVRQIFIPIPMLAMFLPLAVSQWNRGRPLATLADPGLPVLTDPTRGWETVFLFPNQSFGGIPDLLAFFNITTELWIVLAILLAPLAILAVYGIFTPGWRVSLAGFTIAVAGFVTAGIAGGVSLASMGGVAVPLWVGGAQSLGFLGLLMAGIAGAAFLGPVRAPVTALAVIGALALIVPLVPAQLNGTSEVEPSSGRTLPALVDAQGRDAAQIGTLVLTPIDQSTMQSRLERGSGRKLDEISTLYTTAVEPTDTDERLADVAVDFLAAGATNPTAKLHELGIAFVLIEPAPTQGAALEQRLITALSTNEAFQAAGEISEHGALFHVVNAAEQPTDPELAEQLGVTNWQNDLGRGMLIVQAAVLIFVILLALPTGGLASRARTLTGTGPRRWERLDDDEEPIFAGYGTLSRESVDVYRDSATGDHVEGGFEGGSRG